MAVGMVRILPEAVTVTGERGLHPFGYARAVSVARTGGI